VSHFLPFITLKKNLFMAKKTKLNQGIKIIKKANTLIEARYRFDVWETRMFLSMLACIRMEDEDFQPYRIWFRDIIKIFGLKSHQSYDLLRDASKSLMKKTFHVNYMDNGFVREKAYHIIRTTDYLKEGQTGTNIEAQEYIDITIDPEMKPLLLQLKSNFTAYDLRNVAKLGAQPVRLYELLKQFEGLGGRTLEIEYMKRILELDTEYKNVFDFYRYFIIPALNEINKYTDIFIYDHQKIKEGKKVVGLHFMVRKKSEEDLAALRGTTVTKTKKAKILPIPEDVNTEVQLSEWENPPSDSDRLFTLFYTKVVENLGVTPSVFMDLLKNYNEQQIHQAIRVTNRAKINGQIKSNVSGFFVKALKEGFTDHKEELEKKKIAETSITRQKTGKEQKQFAEKMEIEKRINDKIRQIIEDNPNITSQAIEALKEDVLIQKIVELKENNFGRPLDIQDYRDDSVLMNAVRMKIVELKKDQFEAIL
jgi:plasmid replication initiation protein